MERYK